MRKQKKDNDVLPPDFTINKEIRKWTVSKTQSFHKQTCNYHLGVYLLWPSSDQMASDWLWVSLVKGSAWLSAAHDDSSVFQLLIVSWLQRITVSQAEDKKNTTTLKSFQCGTACTGVPITEHLRKTRPLRKWSVREGAVMPASSRARAPSNGPRPQRRVRSGDGCQRAFCEDFTNDVKPKATAIRWKVRKALGPICLQSQTGIKSDQSQKTTEAVWHLSKVLGSLFSKDSRKEWYLQVIAKR